MPPTSSVADSVVGYGVEAIDGSMIGTVDDTTYDVNASYVVVETGPWIFGKKILLPISVIREIDDTQETIFVHGTKDEVKHLPEYDDSMRARE